MRAKIWALQHNEAFVHILYAGITLIRLTVSNNSGHNLSLTPQAPVVYLVVNENIPQSARISKKK
jgi:hypothetical protein